MKLSSHQQGRSWARASLKEITVSRAFQSNFRNKMYSAPRNSPRWDVMGDGPTQAQSEALAREGWQGSLRTSGLSLLPTHRALSLCSRSSWEDGGPPTPSPDGGRSHSPGGAGEEQGSVVSRTGEVTSSWRAEARALLAPGSSSGKLALFPSRCLGGPQWKR